MSQNRFSAYFFSLLLLFIPTQNTSRPLFVEEKKKCELRIFKMRVNAGKTKRNKRKHRTDICMMIVLWGFHNSTIFHHISSVCHSYFKNMFSSSVVHRIDSILFCCFFRFYFVRFLPHFFIFILPIRRVFVTCVKISIAKLNNQNNKKN